jgi:hypothetical protein
MKIAFRAMFPWRRRGNNLRFPLSEEPPVRWSVTLAAEGDRVMTREEIVELADAVAAHSGIASGIGTTRYGAQLSVEADTREAAVESATATFAAAVKSAGLPPWPIADIGVIGEDDDDPGFLA